MKLLPNRHVDFPPPLPPIAAAREEYGEFIPSEESALFWLWGWPKLLGWSRNIYWLCSPDVDSSRNSPGYLSGVDSTGSLIVVKTMQAQGVAVDPFETFVRDVKSAFMNGDWSSEVLRARWLKCAPRQEDFFESQLARFWLAFPAIGTYRGPGSDPFSREITRRVQLINRTSIAPSLRDGTYERRVRHCLTVRESIGNPLPVCMRVIVSPRSGFRLLQKARKSRVQLQKLVGRDRVALRVLNANLNDEGLRVHCRTSDH